MEPPPPRAARSLPRAAALALVLAGLLGGVVALRRGVATDDAISPASTAREAEAAAGAPEALAPPPALAGLGRTEPARSVAGAAGAIESVGAGAAAPAGPAAPASPTSTAAPGYEFLAVAPDAFVDHVSAGANAPIPLPRELIVGRVGAFGVRDLSGATGPRFVGVARIDPEAGRFLKDPAEGEGPAVTALHGVVVGEDGNPVAGAEVLVYSSFYVRQAHYDHRVQQIGRMVTGSDGVFDLRPIALDTIHFGADGEVLATLRHSLLAHVVAQRLPTILPGEETDVGRWVLPTRGAAVHGTIRDMEGRPVAGAVVRVSGAVDPTAYDKTERMIVLDACPSSVTDEQGRYRIEGFAPGVHEVSVHIRIDCVMHGTVRLDGDLDWSPRVLAGNAIRGRVVDAEGEPIAAAVVAGGGNWTPTNADGTFWLDNVQAGPLTLYVVHHDWRAESVPNVPTDSDGLTVTLARPLPRVTVSVVDAARAPVPIVAIDWAWPPGGGPRPFSTESRYFHDARGSFSLVIPEGAVGATVSDALGGTATLAADDLVDGARRAIALAARVGGD